MARTPMVDAKNYTLAQKRALVESIGGKFGSVIFRKQDNTLREMSFKRQVRAAYANGSHKEHEYSNAHQEKYVPVVDMDKGAFRTLNLETMVSLKVNGKNFIFV